MKIPLSIPLFSSFRLFAKDGDSDREKRIINVCRLFTAIAVCIIMLVFIDFILLGKILILALSDLNFFWWVKEPGKIKRYESERRFFWYLFSCTSLIVSASFVFAFTIIFFVEGLSVYWLIVLFLQALLWFVLIKAAIYSYIDKGKFF